MLAYFGTDQSQVQRYLSGDSLRESRLGLMFNAVLKIPMQFFILLLGVLIFVFYQFEQPPLFFNQAAWQAHAQGVTAGRTEFASKPVHASSRGKSGEHLKLAERGSTPAIPPPKPRPGQQMLAAQQASDQLIAEDQGDAARRRSQGQHQDADYVFITFILHYLPHGIIGLLVAVIFAAGLSSKSAELNALGSTTTVDFYRHLFTRRRPTRITWRRRNGSPLFGA